MGGSLRLAALVALVLAAGAAAAATPPGVRAPAPFAPAAGAVVPSLPPFGWRAVPNADHYEFQLGADPSFNSPVLGRSRDTTSTQNTWATVDQTVPNGTYWWHVRAVSATGTPSAWSAPRPLRKQWRSVPKLLSPASGAAIKFPTTPLVLQWSPVPFAAKYLVYLATDSDLGSLVGDKPIETHGVTYSPSVTLANGTYYWAVVPIDAGGNRGARSRTASFSWVWDSHTTLKVTDLVAATEHFDPQFSWKAVPGAARYEIEINPSHEWSISSKVCCKDPVVTTTFSPTTLLPNNRYYWRVRAIDVNGNAGGWNEGPVFEKVFDNVEPSQPTIKNVHMEDSFGNAGGVGFATTSPIVAWDPVPGAALYELDVVMFLDGTCYWGRPVARPQRDIWRGWHGFTAVPAWTPASEAATPSGQKLLVPYSVPKISPDGHQTKGPRPTEDDESKGGTALVPGSYCVRIRAYSDDKIYGNYTYFPNPDQPGFTFTDYPSGGEPLSAGTYLQPAQGKTSTSTPVFRWKPVAGAASYWVIVSKDRSFTTIVDYAFTRIPAWAPRNATKQWTYTDEETEYYWAILPSPCGCGSPAPVDPNLPSIARASFRKQSNPPSLLSPAKDGSVIVGPPTFRWSPVPNALDYQVQVSADRNFGTLLEDQRTDSTSYTATKTYPANAALYVRIRAEDGNEIELSWSSIRRFRNTLAKPVPSATNPRSSDLIPTWTWGAVDGARSYDLHVDLPNGSTKDFSDNLLTAFTATSMTGTGVFRWQVRAEFAEARGGRTAVGPYSKPVVFTRTIRPPVGARAVVGPRSLLLLWSPKLGADHYVVEIASTPDFGRTVEREETDNTAFAPELRREVPPPAFGRAAKEKVTTQTFYWRVAAVDADRNSGNYTPVRKFTLRLPRKKGL